MLRIKSSSQTRSRHNKILKMAKGHRGRAGTCYSISVQKVEKGLQYAYSHRKQKKRSIRNIWVQRINAASLSQNTNYSNLINSLTTNNVVINRKILSELSYTEPYTFNALLQIK